MQQLGQVQRKLEEMFRVLVNRKTVLLLHVIAPAYVVKLA